MDINNLVREEEMSGQEMSATVGGLLPIVAGIAVGGAAAIAGYYATGHSISEGIRQGMEQAEFESEVGID